MQFKEYLHFCLNNTHYYFLNFTINKREQCQHQSIFSHSSKETQSLSAIEFNKQILQKVHNIKGYSFVLFLPTLLPSHSFSRVLCLLSPSTSLRGCLCIYPQEISHVRPVALCYLCSILLVLANISKYFYSKTLIEATYKFSLCNNWKC